MKRAIAKRALSIAAAVATALMAATAAIGAEAAGGSDGEGGIGMVLATMNTAFIQRGGESFLSRSGDYIRVKDAFETAQLSKTKILMNDGGTITLDEISKMSVEGFTYGEGTTVPGEPGGGGQSEFKLFGGFMRAVSGRNGFEIQTDEAVISGKDAVVEIVAGSEDGRLFTAVACLDGAVSVEVKESPGVPVKIAKNQIVTVMKGEPVMRPLTLPSTGIKAMNNEEIAKLGVKMMIEGIQKELGSAMEPDAELPIRQQPVATTPVTVRIEFP